MSELLPILDAALGSAVARSGEWLACRPGCHQCCLGVFPISSLDADTLRRGLDAAEPGVAARIRERSAASRVRLTPGFPGDPASGRLFTEPNHEEAFDEFANDEPCPVLDPATGTCDLYAARPVPCRTFGPPLRQFSDYQPEADAPLTVCELCFVDAPTEEVARCELDQSWRPLEERLIAQCDAGLGNGHEPPKLTLVAFALR